MKIAIIDDEIYWREYTEKIVHQYYGDSEIDIDIFENGEIYLKSKECYDITLVDIEMPVIDGFEIISKAREYNNDGIYIILTTHVEMSRRGYLVNAFRYIDKTKLEEELSEAMKSAKILLGRNEKVQVNVVGEGQRELVLKDIIYVETEKHCVLVHTKHAIMRCSNKMSDLEDALNGKWFYRCHNSFIVNLDEIKSINDSLIFMSNGDEIYTSTRKLWKFRKLYLQRQYECANG